MKNIKIRSFMLLLIIIGFFSGICFFSYDFLNNSREWAFALYNRHLSENDNQNSGKILDRFGKVLASTENGERIYNEDKKIRTALLHTVGDGFTLIPSSVQSRYASDILGYNLITGFGASKAINSSKDIILTLDSELCSKVSSEFKNKKGTALAYNYQTGEILCMVSLPTYDPDEKPNFNNDTENKFEGIYLNRAISSSYTPGSVFKIFTTIAALDLINDVENKKYLCEKIKLVDGKKVACMQYHGKIDLKNALCKSCDILFGDIALELGREKMTQKMEELGFNKKLYFEDIELSTSSYSVKDSTDGDLAWSGIGQHKDTLNPMHMLKIMGAIANDGKSVNPCVIRDIKNSNDKNLMVSKINESTNFISPETANKVKEMMRYTMKNQYKDSMFSGIAMCAKTGTAEVSEGQLPHGWMVGFSYDNSFPIAFVVVVENGDFGIKSAGPIASNMIKHLYTYFKKEKYN